MTFRCYLARAAALAVLVLATGCASTRDYFVDRGRDAADIITLSAGKGTGLQLRGGPLQLGWMYTADTAGFRSGCALHEPVPDDFPPPVGGLVTPLYSVDSFQPEHSGRLPVERLKTYRANGVAIVTTAEEGANWVYYTQLEAAIGAGGHLRFGLNLGEAVDFLLGLFTLDIAADDVGSQTP